MDLIVGGYPCQPFSSAGKRLGEDDPRHLWPEIRRITKEIKPRFVFFENVAGHLTLGLCDVLRDLQEMGFRCSAGLFTAEEVGASHRRERLFILGMANRDSGMPRSESSDWRAERIKKESDDHGCGRELADTVCKLCQRRMAPEERERLSTFEHDCGELADAMSNRSQGIDETWTTDGTTERSDGSKLPDFPPGPKDFDAWRRIIEQHKELSPSIEREFHRMDDGLASRVDRLRACGNGVVPLVAAYAFTTLLACLE